MIRFILLFLSFNILADNEIYINQVGSNFTADIEQLGSSNLIGDEDAVSGTMTKMLLNGTYMTLDLNQIGSSNKFLSNGIYGDNFTGYFDFTGDSNTFKIDVDAGNTYTTDYANLDIDFTGSLNSVDLDIADNASASYLDLDWTILGSSNTLNFDIDYENATNFMDINGGSNSITFQGEGYSGTTASDSGYFYLDLDGSSNTYTIKQLSTLARDWLKIESTASNQNVCIIQSDGGTSTSC